MKTIISYLIFSTCVLLLFTQCEKNITYDNNSTNRAKGTYLIDSVDKEKWGDFELVLEMKKSIYMTDDSIDFKLYFSNIGEKTISFPGILPQTQMGYAPNMVVWSSQQRFFVDSIVAEINNDIENVVPPHFDLTLMKFNLRNVQGILWQQKNNWVQETGIIGDELLTGTYYAIGYFFPALSPYCSITDTLTFTIK